MLNPVAMSIITNTFTDRARAGPGDRRVGRRVRPQHGARPGSRRRAGRTRSAGAGSSGSTSRSASRRSCSPRCSCRSRRRSGPAGSDPVGQVLLIVLLATLTYAIIEGPARGLGVGADHRLLRRRGRRRWSIFLRYESRREDPLLDPRFFRSAPFAGATVTAVTIAAALGGFLFLNTLYLQDVRGFSALTAGLYLLPMALTMAVACARLSGRIVASRGPRWPMVVVRHRADRQRCPADQAHRDLRRRLPVPELRDPRCRSRPGQRADHQLRGIRHAPAAGRGRGRRCLREPPGRAVTGRSGDGLDTER